MSETRGCLRALRLRLAVLAAGLCAALPVEHAYADTTRTTFVILRNGEPIGTHTIDVARTGSQTTIGAVTHIAVTLAFVTLYRFDQTETEEWSDRRIVALQARTDDNGSIHQTSVGRTGDSLTIRRDGHDTSASATVMPLDLWNPAVLEQTTVLDPQNGSVVPLRATDRGEEDFVSRGHAIRAHHYTIATTYSQDVWYDKNGVLVGVQLTGSDGSIIRYQLA